MSDNSPSDKDVQNKVTNDFKKKVLKWLEIDDEIRAIRAKTKELTNDKKQYEEFILSFLEDVGEKELAVNDGKLRRNVSKTKAPLNKASIQKALDEIVKDKTKATTMTDHIINSRPMVERVNLKRTKNRGPKKDKNQTV
tara:strand:+ start:378 stop:794 length:417 start_codon:yes stop_codon:yes gene_type:complete